MWKYTPIALAVLASVCLPSVAAAEKDQPKWQVNGPANAPQQSVKIKVDQGTWMNLSLSPDGKYIAFDLLGDIYRMPITGGKAEKLLGGIAWQMQPTYSPDGKYIAFTSDADGGDNLWVMDADGRNPRAVTKETFRLLNSPAWSPDSQYLIARKHFTAQRSLGAGEVWLYHLDGGEGVQLTERPNDQKDLGEPAYSPDGRYVYFSQDATPGKYFEYSKDSVKGIYKIKRYDTQTGEIKVLIEGTGGAIRPTPSPDGKKLAYIKRDGFQSALYIYDLASGKHTQVYDQLDRDMQETWAIHGVYPSMAWDQDSNKLYFWAQGKINQLHVASQESKVIPFSVETQLHVQKPVRPQQQLDQDEFSVKMLRMAQVSPNGKQVVYEALGKLWLQDTQGGKPKRLTQLPDEVQELSPQWSRNGEQIVFSTWDDAEQGRIQLINVSWGSIYTLTPEPGKYVEPTFSPDGKTVVYRKAKGGYITSPTWSTESGLYQVDSEGARSPEKISDSGYQPQFGADNQRVFFMDYTDKPALSSISLTGHDKRVHYTSEHATEFRVSPDGQQLAFAERFKVFVTPFAKHGETVQISPNAKNLPVTQLSTRAGESISWGGDNQSLYWTLGPELYTAKINQDKAKDKVKINKLGFKAKVDVPRGTIAFVGGQVITMEQDKVIEKGVVIIKDDEIISVGDSKTKIPAEAKIFDISGKTIMPGLFDAHAHGPQGEDEIIPKQNWINYAGLALGVTSIHDPSNDTTEIFAASEQQKAGKIIAPRIFSTGTILYGANAPGYTSHIDSLDDAKFHLERLKKVGAFSVKSYNQPRREQRQQVIAAARELDMMVVPEGGSLLQHNLTMIVDGHTTIEHSLPVAKIYDDIKQLWQQTKVAYTPTLVVSYGGISGEHYWYDKTDVWAHPRLSEFVPKDILEARSMRRTTAPDEHYNHFNVVKVAHELNELGVKSNIGAHGQREGLGAHWEMWMFAQGGMSNLEVLKTATINPASTFGMDKQLGSIKVGKLADLIVIDGDPLTDIRVTDRVDYTMVNGKLFDAKTMDQLNGQNGDTVKRAEFFFENHSTPVQATSFSHGKHNH